MAELSKLIDVKNPNKFAKFCSNTKTGNNGNLLTTKSSQEFGHIISVVNCFLAE